MVAASGAAGFEVGAHVVRNRLPQLDLAFTAGPTLERVTGERFTVFHRGSDPAAIAAVVAAAGNVTEYLNDRFGARRPFEGAHIVIAERPGPSYARKNYIVVDTVIPDRPVGLHTHLCHEFSHFWTLSLGPNTAYHWMTESFAEYVTTQFRRSRFGERYAEADRTRWARDGAGQGPVWTPDRTERPTYQAIYLRGPWMLSKLEDRIGEQLFNRLVERYMVDGIRSTQALLDALVTIAGQDDAAWFREMLARTDDPE